MNTKKIVVKAARSNPKATTYEIDIAQEFKDVKTTFSDGLSRLDAKLDAFKLEISGWKSIFDTKLTELNHNMKTVLDKIAEHELRFNEHNNRIKALEDSKMVDATRKETMSEMAKFGWLAAKVLFCAGAIVGALGGCGLIFKTLFGG